MKNPLISLSAAACLLFLGASANASSIDSTPIHDGSPFSHNVFHTASSCYDGQCGTILAWFNMNSSGGSWDGTTGSFNLGVDLYGTAAEAIAQDLSDVVGSATATGTLALSALHTSRGGTDSTAGGLFGSIVWAFDESAATKLDIDSSSTTITMYFEDNTYGSSGANSWDENSLQLTLWGQSNLVSGDLVPSNSGLGMDLVAKLLPDDDSSGSQAVVPIPAAVWLFGSGLLVLMRVSRGQA